MAETYSSVVCLKPKEMNYSKDLFKQLENAGYTTGCWKDVYNDMDECKAEEAKQLLISNFNEGIVGEVIKLPKKKEITFEWIMGKLHKESQFISLASHCAKLVPDSGISIYPTSYGIGISVLFAFKGIKDRIKQLEELFTRHSIEYRNEYSEAGYVYRFKLSKASENIEKLKLITT